MYLGGAGLDLWDSCGTPWTRELHLLLQSTSQSFDLGSSGGSVEVGIQGSQTNLGKPIETCAIQWNMLLQSSQLDNHNGVPPMINFLWDCCIPMRFIGNYEYHIINRLHVCQQ
jgi:hypothetical protein